MSSRETQLLIRMLRYQAQVDETQLRELLDSVRRRDIDGFLEQLRHSTLVDDDWIEWAQKSLRRKARRNFKESEDQRHQDRSFGQLALARGWVRVGILEDAILEQQRLRRLNLRFRLGEILVRHNALSVSQVRELLSEQGHRHWSCVECDAVITALPSADGNSPEGDLCCPLCSGELRAAVFLEPVRSDACLEQD